MTRDHLLSTDRPPARHPVFSFVAIIVGGAVYGISGQPRPKPAIYRDPSPRLVSRLRRRFPDVRRWSLETYYKHRYPAWRSDSGNSSYLVGCGSNYWAGPIRWTGKDKAVIEGGSKGNIGGDSDYGPSIVNRYHLVSRGGRWLIRAVKQIAAAG